VEPSFTPAMLFPTTIVLSLNVGSVASGAGARPKAAPKVSKVKEVRVRMTRDATGVAEDLSAGPAARRQAETNVDVHLMDWSTTVCIRPYSRGAVGFTACSRVPS
jgi:hypothetical protein